MRHDEYLNLAEEGVDFGIDSSLRLTPYDERCVVDGFFALPLAHVSPRFPKDQALEIRFADRPGDKRLCYLLTCAGAEYLYSTASGMYVAAFLCDAEISSLAEINSGTYKFKKNYVLVSTVYFHRYQINFQNSSHLWGGFYHEGALVLPMPSTKCGEIIAHPGLELPTQLHESEAFRANNDASSIGRYLALYHLIELSFDYDLVEDIKALPSDLKLIGKLLATFDHGELPRLNRLIKKYWTDEKSLAEALRYLFEASVFDSQLLELMFDYDKDGFPWRFKDDQSKFSKFKAAAKTSFDKSHFESQKLGWSLEQLQKSVSFAIYRFRCAIAHASIGEYVISADDDLFVETKGEPLVTAALLEIFKSQK